MVPPIVQGAWVLGSLIHGHDRRTESPTYRSWRAMKQRCLNPNHLSWERYGGRGISICERWLSFQNFLADMGERPEAMTLDRIDPNGNYEPGNARWATPKQQITNRRPIRPTLRRWSLPSEAWVDQLLDSGWGV